MNIQKIVEATVCVFASPAARADDNAAPAANAGAVVNDDGIHINIGLAYTTGPVRIYNDIKDDYSSSFTSVTGVVIPVGLKIDPYYQFDFGLGIGASFGPVEGGVVTGAANNLTYFVIPVGVDARYTLMPIKDSGILPYVRVGVRYPIAVGNLVGDGQPGLFAAVGVNFTAAHIGLEAAYDSSTVHVNANGFTATERPNEFMFTLSFYF